MNSHGIKKSRSPCSCQPLEETLSLLRSVNGKKAIQLPGEGKERPIGEIVDLLARQFKALIRQVDQAASSGKPLPCSHHGTAHQARQILEAKKHPIIQWELKLAQKRRESL